MRLLIRGGHVLDVANNVDEEVDLLIERGEIVQLAPNITPSSNRVQVIEAKGKLVLPGLVDMHVHFRQPGREDKETIATGARAAARGGFTSVCTMPNTTPPVDNRQVVEFILAEAAKVGLVRVYPVGAITKGLAGRELTEIAELKEARVVAITDDGRPVMDTDLMRRAMEYAKMCGLLVISHCEDLSLTEGCVMNEGLVATTLGLRGMPNMSEAVVVAREIFLAELTGARVHCTHLSAKESVELVRQAKRRGLPISCDVTPHHLALTDESARSYDPNFKMNPPLRTQGDIEALREGLKDGTIDAIATDHAPHTEADKDVDFDHAPFGVVGLETALGVIVSELVEKGVLSWKELVTKMSLRPAKVLGIPGGSLAPGEPADLVIVDPEKKWTVKAEEFQSKSRNSPFIGRELKGKVVTTIAKGEIIYHE